MAENKIQLPGFFRAQVLDNKDEKMFGRVLVWIPDIMPKSDPTKGLWALPANNCISGLNDDGVDEHQFAGSCLIPPAGSYVWVFFENGNPNRPYYLSGLNLQNTKVLPECRLGSNPQKKWVMFKSHSGRTVVISDDPDDERVEITGKKRKIKEPPSGDEGSVYTIDGNQTTFLIDERDGFEKILIRSHKGDFINFDIENRKLQISLNSDVLMKSEGKLNIQTDEDINIKSKQKILITTDSEIHLKSKDDICISTAGDINLKAGGSINQSSSSDINIKSLSNVNIQATGVINNLAVGAVLLDGSAVLEMTGSASPAGDARDADIAEDSNPQGDRGE